MVQRTLGVIVLLLVILLCVLFLEPINNSKNDAQVYSVSCPLQKSHCLVHLTNKLSLDFTLSPLGLPVLEPLFLSVKSLHLNINELNNFKVWFEGRDMDMGKHFFQLNVENLPSKATHISGTGMIPICMIDSNMVWRLVSQFSFRGRKFIVLMDLIAKDQNYQEQQ